MKRMLFLLFPLLVCCGRPDVDVTLVPPVSVSDKAAFDIRTGLVHHGSATGVYDVAVYLQTHDAERLVSQERVQVAPGEPLLLKQSVKTAGMSGKYNVLVKVRKGLKTITRSRPIEVVPSPSRATATIDGAWAGLYHWSETEGLHWNRDIRHFTAEDWKGVVRAMHHIGMDIIVIQELFRHEAYVNAHDVTLDTYPGKAYYPSSLYPGRMDIACPDPVEAIMAAADELGMHVLPGIGLFAWFDFGETSLQWHKAVAKEVYDRYGHHPSFYGFYVSEECFGCLDGQIAGFFEQFTDYCRHLAPAKPVMLATNCFGIQGKEAEYAALLKHLDILCPFGFSRMPEGDLSGKEAAATLQRWCDAAGAHLWMDLEAFAFNPDGSLSPRSFPSIRQELAEMDGFEKILCYQYPGVFNNPAFHRQAGEDAGIKLYADYMAYRMSRD